MNILIYATVQTTHSPALHPPGGLSGRSHGSTRPNKASVSCHRCLSWLHTSPCMLSGTHVPRTKPVRPQLRHLRWDVFQGWDLMVKVMGWGTIPMLNTKAALLNYCPPMAFLTSRFYVAFQRNSWLIVHIVTQNGFHPTNNAIVNMGVSWILSISAPVQSLPSSTAEHCLSKKNLQRRKEEHERTVQ